MSNGHVGGTEDRTDDGYSAWDVNHSAGNLLETLLHQSHFRTRSEFIYLETVKEGGRLRICPNGITNSFPSPIARCPVIFPVENIDTPVLVPEPVVSLDRRDVTMVPVFIGNNLTSVMIVDSSQPDEVITLSPVCVQALQWPYQTYVFVDNSW